MLIAALMVSTTARAGNDDEVLLGDDAAMMGGAVTAVDASGSSLIYNPAGLSDVREDTIDLSVSAFTFRRSVARELLSTSDGERNPADLTEFLIVPAALAYVRPVNDRVRVALGIFQTNAQDFIFNSSLEIPRMDSRVDDWGLSVARTQNDYQGSLGVGWKVAPTLSLGFAAHVTYSALGFSTQLSGSTRDPGSDMADVFAAESALGASSSWGWRVSAGLQWQAHERVRVGLSVASPSMLITSSRELSLFLGGNGVDTVGPLVLPGADASFTSTRTEERVNGFEMILPTRVRLGVALTLDGGMVSVDGDYQHAVSNDALDIDRRPVWNLRIGGQLDVSSSVRLGAGLFTDRDSNPRGPNFGDGAVDFYGGTLGMHFGEAHELAESEEDDRIHFETTLALRYSFGHGHINGLLVDSEIGEPSSPVYPRSRFVIHELALYVASSLLF